MEEAVTLEAHFKFIHPVCFKQRLSECGGRLVSVFEPYCISKLITGSIF